MYDQKLVEESWQKIWEDNQLFQQSEKNSSEGDKMYLLFAFAYPSGQGLHVGHVESKTALDIMARYYRMHGKNVFFPVGWDAFGLPAENYAIKTGVHPAKTTVDAINTFRRQIKRIGVSYDWANELATSHPEYYKWTQWIFLQLFSKGLAYRKDGKVNWCPSCQTVLANEQVVEGLCERCDNPVVQKDMKQWYFQITKYQDELVDGLDEVDWPSATKAQQINWIGRKTGIDITYQVVGFGGEVAESAGGNTAGAKTTAADEAVTDADLDQITCFTTRPDTNFGATFVVLAPEHQLAQKIADGSIVPEENANEIKNQVAEYLDQASKKTELDRQQEGKKKSGVFTGLYAVNQLTKRKMPIWVSDFVLGGFGTGAVVGVPGHDLRDFEFAQFVNQAHPDKKIEVIRVVVGRDGDESEITKPEQVQEEQGKMVNSDFLDGMEIHDATQKIMDHMEEKNYGKRVTSYRLRDWLISRQRYWGAPIPIIYDPDDNPHPVVDEYLPWELPTDVDFKPTGESPLRSSAEFQARTEKLAAEKYADLIKQNGWDKSGKGWHPEYDTMDTFVDSSWYYFRYVDSRNSKVFAAKEQLEKWLPVDFYMIGPEHIVLHLLYSRFFTKFLKDEGYINFNEPFLKMRHQGMILGPDNKKMSKSKGNVINPDEIIEKFGADTLRVYEMFMGPLEADKPWDIRAVIGVYKFLQKVHKLVVDEGNLPEVSGENKTKLQRKLHQTIKKVSDDIPKLKFNTAIAFMMEFVNLWQEITRETGETLLVEDKISFTKVISPFAPFLADEMYLRLSGKASDEANYQGVHISNWPDYNSQLAAADVVIIPIQVNGKVRAQIEVEADDLADEATVLNKALAVESVKKYTQGSQIKKKIYIQGKIISLVV